VTSSPDPANPAKTPLALALVDSSRSSPRPGATRRAQCLPALAFTAMKQRPQIAGGCPVGRTRSDRPVTSERELLSVPSARRVEMEGSLASRHPVTLHPDAGSKGRGNRTTAPRPCLASRDMHRAFAGIDPPRVRMGSGQGSPRRARHESGRRTPRVASMLPGNPNSHWRPSNRWIPATVQLPRGPMRRNPGLPAEPRRPAKGPGPDREGSSRVTVEHRERVHRGAVAG
jgi:hypothetical protein